MSDQEVTKDRIDRRSMIKTLGSAAATAAIVSARAPRTLAASLPPAEPPQQAAAKKDTGASTKITGGKYMADFFNAYGVTAIFWMPAIMNRTLATMEMEGMPIKRVLPHGEKAAAYAHGLAKFLQRRQPSERRHLHRRNQVSAVRPSRRRFPSSPHTTQPRI